MYYLPQKNHTALPAERIEIGNLPGQGLCHYYVALITPTGLLAFVPCALPMELARTVWRLTLTHYYTGGPDVFDITEENIISHADYTGTLETISKAERIA